MRVQKRNINRRNLGKSVTKFCEKKIEEVEAAIQKVFTAKGQAELDL